MSSIVENGPSGGTHDAMYCPITMEVMVEPVIDNQGVSYEKKAIEAWLLNNDTSPVTRQPLKLSDLKPNHALRDIIEEWRKSNQPGSQASIQSSQPISTAASPSPPAVTLSVTKPDAKGEALAFLQILPPKGEVRTPCDISCVIDVSGSMCSAAKIKNEKGDEESHGLSLLDVVKHAVKTIINTLGPNDRLSIVAYSSTARVVMPLTKMDEAGRKAAELHNQTLSTGGQTNLWAGLEAGMDTLRARGRNTASKPAFVFLLTDGQPNIVPPRGHVPMLQRYKDKYPDFTCTVNTFGFGYNLDSSLLHSLAASGEGMYFFIPDSSFVGTCFVHALANSLVTFGRGATLSLEVLDGPSVKSTMSYDIQNAQVTSWGVAINAGDLRYDQDRAFIVRLSNVREEQGEISAVLTYRGLQHEDSIRVNAQMVALDMNSLAYHQSRVYFVEAVATALDLGTANNLKDSLQCFQECSKRIQEIEYFPDTSSEYEKKIRNILKDIDGQACEAVSKSEWFNRWGKHYLKSIQNAHFLQVCSNFKDPGVQDYGNGTLFTLERDAADDLFVKLPPPKPSRATSSRSRAAAPARQNFSMASYSCAAGPCFAGSSLVHTKVEGNDNIVMKRVDEIKKGDWVVSDAKGGFGRVECVIRTRCKDEVANLVNLPCGLLVTPWHPVKENSPDSKWNYPCKIGSPKARQCKAVFSFLLESGHGSWMMINDMCCITLGHGQTEPVADHSYFGCRESVLKDLTAMKGWDEGLVCLEPGCCLRDSQTGLVMGLVQKITSFRA